MTVDQLREKAMQALRDTKHEIKRTGKMTPLFRAYLPDGTSKELRMPKPAAALMDIGLAKEIICDYLRQMTVKVGVVAWIFVSDIRQGQATEEGKGHLDEIKRGSLQEFAARGWVVVEEAIMVLAQTATDIVIARQVYANDEWIGPPQVTAMPQSEFEGRMKMYGATTEDITGFDPTRKDARRVGVDALKDL